MSRVELSAIQTKLKAAIQNHQMLVVKMKGDNQNASLKKRLTELQDEIKRLSEEQKKIVVRVRENLVKSNPQVQQQPQQHHHQQQQQQPVAPIATIGQTITAIGQPRIVSFPTQGGTTILPVGMVAVPLAHMQRPVGVTLHPGNTGSMSQATSISLIPAGIIRSGCNISLSPINSGATISLSPINSGATISLGNTVSGIIHGSIGVSHLNTANHISTTTNGSVANSNLGIVDGCNQNAHPAISSASNGASLVSAVIPSSGSALTNLTNMTNLIIGTNISNGQNGTSLPLSAGTLVSSNCAGIVPNTSAVLPVAAAAPINTVTVSSSAPSIVISQFPQQPLVQPQLLQQQQQQILQMIQQQQQQPQQRLASHTPIKVPQYTASIIRPAVTSTSVQFCNIAPAPSTVTSTPSAKVVSSSASIPQPAKPIVSKETTVPKEQQPTVEAVKPSLQQTAQPQMQLLKPLETPTEQPPLEKPPAVVFSQDQEKLRFMKVLDLYTIDAIKEVMSRRLERKRRTTANPNYSFGFEFTRRDRNGSVWTEISPKKPKTRGKGTAASAKGNGWTDSTSFPQQHNKASNKVIKSNDNHDDFCAACGRGGPLLMCETCRLVYHLDCLTPPLTEAPKYIWSCPKCLISGKGFAHLNSETLAKVHSYIAKKTAKEDERKKVHRKGREMNTEMNFLENRSKELDAKMKEQTDLQSKLSLEEMKVKEELNKLSDFVRTIRESRTTDHLSASKTNST